MLPACAGMIRVRGSVPESMRSAPRMCGDDPYDPEYRDRVIDEDDPESPSFHIEGKVVSYRAPMGWRA